MADFTGMANRIASLADELATGLADAKLALKNTTAPGNKDITELTGTLEITLVQYVNAPCKVVRSSFIPETTVSAAANSRDMQLKYDDGAGGADTALSALFDGTASTMTAGVRNALSITAGVTIPVGSRVFYESTHNGTGIALNETAMEAELERV